jgi:hypothetical protein
MLSVGGGWVVHQVELSRMGTEVIFFASTLR